jgi:hypothetical protein
MDKEEWMIEATQTLFSNKVKRLNKINDEDMLPLRSAIFNYAKARQLALLSPLTGVQSEVALRGYINEPSEANLASRLIQSYGCNPADIPQLPKELFGADFTSVKIPREQQALF